MTARGADEGPPEATQGLGITLLVALATPAALGLETLARVLLLPAELEQVRVELRPVLTPLSWGLLVATCAAVPVGAAVRRSMLRRSLAKVEATAGGPKRRAEARFEAMFVGTSVPQIPAIFATLALTAGSAPLPVVLAVAVSALAVVAIATRR